MFRCVVWNLPSARHALQKLDFLPRSFSQSERACVEKRRCFSKSSFHPIIRRSIRPSDLLLCRGRSNSRSEICESPFSRVEKEHPPHPSPITSPTACTPAASPRPRNAPVTMACIAASSALAGRVALRCVAPRGPTPRRQTQRPTRFFSPTRFGSAPLQAPYHRCRTRPGCRRERTHLTSFHPHRRVAAHHPGPRLPRPGACFS